MIRYMIRLYVLLACQMDFRQYPYDVQICPLIIESFSNPNDVVKFAWEMPSEVSCHNNDDNNCSPVRLDQGVKLLQYALAPMVYSVGTARYDEKQGIYTQLKAEFRFSRQLIHHLFQTYVPSTLIVCLAWFSFFMGLDAIPGRATLLVGSMLTLVTMFANSQTFPPATYVKGMDIWMMACLLFKFVAIAEFITVKRLKEMYDDYMKGIAGDVITVAKIGKRSKEIIGLVDSASGRNIIPILCLKKEFPEARWKYSNVKLKGFSGEKIQVLGSTEFWMKHEGKEERIEFIVTKKGSTYSLWTRSDSEIQLVGGYEENKF
ncbi:unnamed protein product [Cyprideis torosa]|uniref:Uncharacterized protein n=1 Tax=Cyprideis torosa TaxID=163714 RepID=A0A7R8WKR2_9CRUS|nr:unnamed protein product [Cyprideis torosa]CAG0897246.1 unnamed protein product [Cyprideis torosa]